jgi:hypothetical protein
MENDLLVNCPSTRDGGRGVWQEPWPPQFPKKKKLLGEKTFFSKKLKNIR